MMLEHLRVERIESLKSGVLGALSFCLAYGTSLLANSLLLGGAWEINLLVKLAIALLSGFLFGVTYRYILRSDRNPFLKDGAVLAFGLVRGLAPVEVSDNLSESFWLLIILGIESLFCFAAARCALDLAFQRHWIQPFQ